MHFYLIMEVRTTKRFAVSSMKKNAFIATSPLLVSFLFSFILFLEKSPLQKGREAPPKKLRLRKKDDLTIGKYCMKEEKTDQRSEIISSHVRAYKNWGSSITIRNIITYNNDINI